MIFPLFLLIAISSSKSAPTPTFLQCENITNPMGIDEAHPTLSWIYDAVPGNNENPKPMKRWGNESADLLAEQPQTDFKQCAYQIQVATTLNALQTGHPNVWNSGLIRSSNSIEIEYDGKPLHSARTYYWRVRDWDANEQKSEWSTPASWTTTLLYQKDFTAKWIGSPSYLKYVTLYLRKNIDVRFKPKRVLAFASGLGQDQLRIDGHKIGASLTPSWTQYQKSIVVNEYDVTNLLRKGSHCLGMMIGNGMYNMKADTRGSQELNSIGPIKGFLQLEIEKPDGSFQTFGTDGTWQCHASPATYSGEFGGENWDGRKDISGWDKHSYISSNWPKAVVLPVNGKLYGLSHDAPPVNCGKIELGKLITRRPQFDTYSFAYNCPRVPFLRVKGPAGTVVKCWPAEYINADGTVNQNSMRAGKYISYTLNGSTDGESYSPAFWYVGSRYWQVTATDPSGKPINPATLVQSFGTAPEYSSNVEVGQFSCSNKLLNQINELVLGAMKSNFASIITDCPHREKSGWLEEDNLMGPSLMYCFDMRSLFHKISSDMADAQHPNGCIPTMAPEYFFYSRAYSDSDEWGGSFLIVPQLMRQWYGNQSFIKDHLTEMAHYVDYLTSQSHNGIVDYGLGDWDGGGTDPRTPVGLTDTAFYYLLTKDLASFETSNPTLAKKYLMLAKSIRIAFNAKYLNSATGKYGTGSQSGQATALDLGLVPHGLRRKAFALMVEDIKDHNYAVSCGEVGHPSMLRMLAKYGRSDIVAKIHLQTSRPGYGQQILTGHTTLCESWNGANSGDHFMLGHIVEWIYGDLVGIKPLGQSNGFQRFSIAPMPVSQVTWAKASFASPRGLIISHWIRTNNKFTLLVRIPDNTSARIKMPYDDSIQVDRIKNGRNLRMKKFANGMSLPSGTYQLVQKVTMK